MPLFRRKDGDCLDNKLSPSRRFLPYVLGGANDSFLLWEEIIHITPVQEFIRKWNDEHDPDLKITLHHCLLRACAKAYPLNLRMNKFIAGKRYYQRKGIYISYSAKKEHSAAGGLLIFKRLFDPDEPFEAMIRDLKAKLSRDRSVKVAGQEKEEIDYLKLPSLILAAGMLGVRVLDFFNLLPHSFIEGNPMYAGMFIANLGSLGINSGWHHLYHFGNISLFGVMGAPYKAPVVVDDQVVARDVVSLKWTFDERIEDGYNAGRAAATVTRLLENPQELI